MNKDIEALERGLQFFQALKGESDLSIPDLIERLDQRYGNPNAKDCSLIQQAIKALRSQQEEIHALLGDVMEMAKGQE